MDLLVAGLKEISSKFRENEAKDSAEYFNMYCRDWKHQKSGNSDSTFPAIPRFYLSPSSKPESQLQQKLRDVARAEFFLRQGDETLNNDELKELCVGLDRVVQSSDREQSQSLNYEEIKGIVENASQKLKNYFKPSVIVKLLNNKRRISVADILNYTMKKTWMIQSKLGLHLYDSNGLGYLTINDLKNYIEGLIPTLTQLDRLDESFYPFYVSGAVGKFVFFLDPLHTRKIKIQDILMSTFLDDIVDLRDEDLPEEIQEANWFSAPTALRVYGQYIYLDSDNNGMLSKREFARFGSGTLTSIFIDRIFQECQTYGDEIDYNTYLEIVLAMENKSEPQSLQFLFRLLDINGRGYLDGFTLNYFFKGIQEQMYEADQEPALFEDVKDEIFDMIKPVDPCKITLEDLVKSGHGDVMINILIELNGFYSYENRELRPPPESADSRNYE